MDCCVIGVGTFGYNVCITLMHHGIKVLAIDRDMEAISAIQDKVTHAICLKILNEDSLRIADIQSVDAVIIAIGDNFQDTIMITALLKKKFEIPMVICRAMDLQHQEILELMGVDFVVLPEQEAGIRLADKLSIRYRNFSRITQEYSITCIKPKKKWIGRSLNDIDELNDERITVFGKRLGEKINKIDYNYEFKNDDIIVVGGNNDYLEDLII